MHGLLLSNYENIMGKFKELGTGTVNSYKLSIIVVT